MTVGAKSNTVWMTVCVCMLMVGAGFSRTPTRAAGGNGANKQAKIAKRGDIRNLPDLLKQRIVDISGRPHSADPIQAYSEADQPSQLFGYFLLDSNHFQPNVFTSTIPGINDGVAPTATGANHDLPTIGSVRMVVEPKPGLPTDPEDPGAFIDVFTDISGLFVVNNESGWYEGWMIYTLDIGDVAPPRADGTGAQFGKITAEDAAALAAMGIGNNVPGSLFTLDGAAPRMPTANDHFPDNETNVVSLFLSMGTFNALQQSDAHSYWEFNQYTNWVFPLYEEPFTGGFQAEFAQGRLGLINSTVPGSGPAGTGPFLPPVTGGNDRRDVGDNPDNPRDPDRALDTSPEDPDRGMVNNPDHKEKRVRFIPSGLAEEILYDVYERPVSFEPAVHDPKNRLFLAYAKEVARIDTNGDGIISFTEADLEDTSDGGQPNDRLFIPVTEWTRFAVTREINDGLLAPRFAPSERAWVLSGLMGTVTPAVPASTNRDGDNR
ncbi:MAG TPA: hypothetical protein PLF26_09620 [Blastocatellia bacterium]|nr:hypothetical protein [Blastocatellia bacterium]